MTDRPRYLVRYKGGDCDEFVSLVDALSQATLFKGANVYEPLALGSAEAIEREEKLAEALRATLQRHYRQEHWLATDCEDAIQALAAYDAHVAAMAIFPKEISDEI